MNELLCNVKICEFVNKHKSVGPLIPLFLTSGNVSSGFQSQTVGSFIPAWQKGACYLFPKIHLWWDLQLGSYVAAASHCKTRQMLY